VILIDTNVILDVVQKRQPHYTASAAVLEKVIRQKQKATLAAHTLTTIHYIVARYRNEKVAGKAIDWLLKYFDIAATGRREMVRARGLGWSDFEDAVVAAAAEAQQCTAIITRNVKDFENSPVPALTPQEYLLDQSPP
jgi:predicted nucleic acid-binding protein